MYSFNRGKFEEKIDKINDLVSEFKENYAKDNEYTLFLANDDIIKYSFNINNIAHLLGVNFDELKLQKLISGENTEELLESLTEKKFTIGTRIMNGSLFENSVFSPYIDQKLKAFKDAVSIPFPKNIKFVCKYNRELNYSDKEIDSITADYIIGKENESNDLVLLFLKRKYDDGNIFVPQSVRLIKNDEQMVDKLANILNRQVITYITNVIIKNNKTNYDDKIILNVFQVANILNDLSETSLLTGSIPCTISAHKYHLKAIKTTKNNGYSTKSINDNIKGKIANDEMIVLSNDEEEQLDDAELLLIDNYNNNKAATTNDGKIKYSQLNEKYIKVCENYELTVDELEKVKEELKNLKEESKKKDEQIAELETFKEDYYDITDKIESFSKTLKKRNN